MQASAFYLHEYAKIVKTSKRNGRWQTVIF